ncbi:MAG: hypothetical protein ACUVYA_00565 [Planctomycetota bacterium]
MKHPSAARTRIVSGQPSWRIATRDVEAFVTEMGGHLGPVVFGRAGRRIAPFAVAPWAEERLDPGLPAIIRVLRGDFFCLPFGANATAYRGERHPVHGETANARWTLERASSGPEAASIALSLRTKVRAGRVEKRISLVAGEGAVYSEHVVSGMSGPMNFGHHAMLRFPEAEGSGVVSTSRFVHGQVFPGVFEDPAQGGYSLLAPGAVFDSLEAVRTIAGETADLTRYPARRGFEDLVQIASDPDLPFAWTAVAFPKERFLWFSLKDPRVLASTIFWFSNGGRHYPPWDGRHVGVLGLEEVTSYFHYGLAESARRNPFSAQGIPTCFAMDPRRPLVVRTIVGVARIPPGFDAVADVRPAPGGRLEFLSRSGKRARARARLEFLSETSARERGL